MNSDPDPFPPGSLHAQDFNPTFTWANGGLRPPAIFQPPTWLQGAKGKAWVIAAAAPAVVATPISIFAGSNLGSAIATAVAISSAGAAMRLRTLALGRFKRLGGSAWRPLGEELAKRQLKPEWEYLRAEYEEERPEPVYPIDYMRERFKSFVRVQKRTDRHPKGAPSGKGGQFC